MFNQPKKNLKIVIRDPKDKFKEFKIRDHSLNRSPTFNETSSGDIWKKPSNFGKT
jgi:hypothetical protein